MVALLSVCPAFFVELARRGSFFEEKALNMLVPRCIVPAGSEPTAFGAEIHPEAVEKWRTRLQKVTVNLEYQVLMRSTRSQEWRGPSVCSWSLVRKQVRASRAR